jgi:hypothetical protein
VFYLNLVVRSEVRTLFETFCKAEPGKKLFTVREFLHFINNHQRDPRQDRPPSNTGTVRTYQCFGAGAGLDPDSEGVTVDPAWNPDPDLGRLKLSHQKRKSEKFMFVLKISELCWRLLLEPEFFCRVLKRHRYDVY